MMIRSFYSLKSWSLFVFIFLMISSFFGNTLAIASVFPTFDRLAPISANVQAPTGLALDQQGRVYVAVTTGDRVSVFSQSGQLLHSIDNLAEPISIAVAANGRIYIGNKLTGDVSVYDNGFTFLFKLGQGDGEFGFPASIAVDNAANTIYVVDRINSAVKVYNSNGSLNTSLGQPGNADGQFYQPVSIAIDTIANELIVLDHQEKLDSLVGTYIHGARIQYFDLNGVFLRGYSKFGYNINVGQLVKPIHVAVDELSRVYVTDSRIQKVMVYDNLDTFLGSIDDAVTPLRTPIGMGIGASKRLYVSSLFADQIEVYGIDDYSALDLAPAALSFTAIEGDGVLTPQNTTITNSGNIAFNWTAASQTSWITLQLADTLGKDLDPGSTPLEIGVDATNLAPGLYPGTVDITLDSGILETINVTLTVVSTSLQTLPTALTFDAEIGTSPVSQTLSAFTDMITPFNWTVTSDSAWLSTSSAAGTTPEDMQVSVDAASQTAGTYTGKLSFFNQADGSASVEVVVTLNVTDQTTPAGPIVPLLEASLSTQNSVGKKWNVTQILPAGTSLHGIWGSSAKDLYVVGDAGTILHNDGTAWTAMTSGSSQTLYSVWGSSESDVYAVGDSGLVLHYNGTNWTSVATATVEVLPDVTGTATDVLAINATGTVISDSFVNYTATGVALRSIWGSSGSDIFVAGAAGSVLHYDGSTWTPMASVTGQVLNSIWGSSGSNVFAVGENGTIIHYNGSTWNTMTSGTVETLQSVWGSSSSDVFAVGTSGLVLHYNGTSWTPVTSGQTVTLNDVWVSSKSEMFAVGEDGIIISGRAQFPWLLFLPTILSGK